MTKARLCIAAAIGVLACTAALAGCARGPVAPIVTATNAGPLGRILVNGNGEAFYIFQPDKAMTVSCTLACASKWPPLTEVKGTSLQLKDGVKASMIGSLPNPDGGKVVTYNGWPLYSYIADQTAGEQRGQDIYLNGGNWYVMGVNGQPVIPAHGG